MSDRKLIRASIPMCPECMDAEDDPDCAECDKAEQWEALNEQLDVANADRIRLMAEVEHLLADRARLAKDRTEANARIEELADLCNKSSESERLEIARCNQTERERDEARAEVDTANEESRRLQDRLTRVIEGDKARRAESKTLRLDKNDWQKRYYDERDKATAALHIILAEMRDSDAMAVYWAGRLDAALGGLTCVINL